MSVLRRLLARKPVVHDDDPVLPLLKDCMPLTLADKRRLHRFLGNVIASQAARTPADAT